MLDILWTTKQIVGALLVFTSIFDAIKYSCQARKIWKYESAKSMSRKFINFAISNDIVKLLYGIVIYDWYIMFSSILALGCMFDLFYAIYRWYPYRHRGLNGFKRPNIILYTLNSILPNSIRRHL
jgi:uncharacterized protein with PQ loop repeat